MPPSRRHFLAGTAVAVGAAALLSRTAHQDAVADPAEAEGGDDAGRRGPNFVVIVADDLGFGEIGAYGQRLMRTPHLDRLAQEGLRFTQAYSTAPVCAPSRCSLLTGLHPGHARVRNNPMGDPSATALRDGDTTFAEVLRARGYRTACIGKWGLGPEQGGQPSHPNSRGFEEFFGYITHGHAHNYYPAYLWHNADKVHLPENAGGRRASYAPDLFRDRALGFIREHKDEPFLLFLTPNLPHAPSDVPSTEPYDDRPWLAPDKGHAAQVTRLDDYVGAILDELREHDLTESTIVLVTSDNGPHEERGFNPDLFVANGGLRGYKRNLYEGGVRVPLIAWSPRRIRPGTSDRPTQQTDLLPTLAELAGAPAPRDIDGRSVAALLDGRPADTPAHPYLYWYRLDDFVTHRADLAEQGRLRRLAEAARQGRWKAVRFSPGRDRSAPDDEWKVELYDLRSDPGETADVADTHPEVAERMVAFMRDAWAEPYDREPFGLTVGYPNVLLPGTDHTLTATLSNGSARPWGRVRLRVETPRGWPVRLVSPRREAVDRLAPGEQATYEWRIRVPAAAGLARWRAVVTASCVLDGAPLRFSAERTFGLPARL
ncbi:sulfatase-like hydrolase/transferase [Actinomadura sp. SCN-SB]|uniref:sulfatase-like hydrolase/transferase n=1 Tax=Actinomadura sp. SCN-SB TaxID=3373092 RepID=UPI003752F968